MIQLIPLPPLAVHELIWGHSIQDLFQMGGPVMLPLLLCSVLAVAIIFERLVVFGRIGGVPKKMVAKVAAALREGRDGDADQLLTPRPSIPWLRCFAPRWRTADAPRSSGPSSSSARAASSSSA